LTNIGTAHDEGFTSRREKIQEKVRLFTSVQKLIYCGDHREVDDVIKQSLPGVEIISWGKSSKDNIYISNIRKEKAATEAQLQFKEETITVTLPFQDEASFENSMHCVAFLLSEKFSPSFIQQQLNLLDTVPKRLELKQGINECYLIDDSYNNDFGGLQIALDFMDQQKQHENKTVILSDLLQTGLDETALYKNIADLLRNRGIKKLIGIGSAIERNKDAFRINTSFFADTESFLGQFDRKNFEKELILVKGARDFHFGKVVALLQQKIHGTVLEIDLDALTHNLNFYRSRLSANTKIMVMVKAFAYGSGSHEVAKLLQFHRVDYLG